MNATVMAFGGLESLVHAPVWAMLMLKITAILLIAWTMYFVLRQANPRWRILVWRVTAVGLIVLPVAVWLVPGLDLCIVQPPVVAEKNIETTTPEAVENSPTAMRPEFMLQGIDGFSDAPFSGMSGQFSGGLTDNLNQGEKEIDPIRLKEPVNTAYKLELDGEKEVAKKEGQVPFAVTGNEPSATSPVRWSQFLFFSPFAWLIVWACGMVTLGVRLALGQYRLSMLVGQARPAPQTVQDECARVAQAIGCRAEVEVLRSSRIVSPFIFGLRRPRLLLPERMCKKSYQADLPGILAHELTHVRSHDIPWNVAMQLISIVLWFHPLIWKMRRAHLAACELVSDAASAHFLGDVNGYCRTLARVAVDACGQLPASGIAMARTSSIMHRLNLLGKTVFHLPLRRRSVLGFGLGMLFSIAILGVLQLAFAAPTVEKPESDKASEISKVSKEEVPSAPFIAMLPNGTKVEVLSVCEHRPKNAKPKWWKPDGSPLEKPLYDSKKFRAKVSPGKDGVAREIAYRVTEGKDDGTWCSVSFQQIGSSAGSVLLDALDGSGHLESKAVAVNKSQSVCSLCVTYADDKWTTDHTTKDGDVAIGGKINMIIPPVLESKGSAILSVSHEMKNRQVRVIAVDLDGKQHESNGGGESGAGEHLKMITAEFANLPLAKVKEFRIQSRAKKRVEIKNISLHAGKKTKAKVDYSEKNVVKLRLNLIELERDSQLAREIAMGNPILGRERYAKLFHDARESKKGKILASPIMITKLGSSASFAIGGGIELLSCGIWPTESKKQGTLALRIEPHIKIVKNPEELLKKEKNGPRINFNVELKPDEAAAFGGWEEIFRKPAKKDRVTFLVVQANLSDKEDNSTIPWPEKPKSTDEVKKTETEASKETLRVHVLDKEDKPVEGAEVHASIWTEEKGFKSNQKYKTDPQGEVEVNLPKTYFIIRLFVTKDAYVPTLKGWEENWLKTLGNRLPKEYTFKIAKGTVIGGVVQDEERKPIEGAKVEVKCNSCSWLATGSDALRTDSKGRWTLNNVPGSPKTKVTLSVTHPDYISDEYNGGLQKEAEITTEMLRNQTATLTMKRGIRIQGQVTDPDGKPIEGATVVRGDRHYATVVPHRFATDKEGRFCLPAVKPQKTKLTVVAPGWAPQLREIEVARGMADQDFRMAAGKPVELRFVDTDGKPVPKVSVHLERWKGCESIDSQRDPNHPKTPSTKIPKKSDSKGLWRWDNAPNEPVQTSIWCKGYISHELTLTGGDATRTLVMRPEHRVTGTVTDAVTGKPIPSFKIIPIDVFRDNWLNAERFNARPGKNGQLDYHVWRTDIPVRLLIEAKGYRSKLGPEFRVGDADARVQNFKLQPSEPISGIVVDAKGQPVKEAEVFLGTSMQEIEPDDKMSNYKKRTDAKGRFSFPDPGEPVMIFVQTKNGFAQARFPVDQHDLGTLKLQPWASVRGRFYDGGKPVRNAWLMLYPMREKKLDEPKLDASLQIHTDKEGRFEFPRVMPGRVRVWTRLDVQANKDIHFAPSVPLDLKPGQKVELDLGCEGVEVHGKVQLTGKMPDGLDCQYFQCGLTSREPVLEPSPELAKLEPILRKNRENHSDKTAEGKNRGRAFRGWGARVAPDGSFRISGVPAGQYNLGIRICSKPENCVHFTYATKSVPVTITEKDINEGKITLPEITMELADVPDLVGKPIFKFQKPDGSVDSTESLHGNYTVLHFWVGWAPSCRESCEDLRKLQKAFSGRGVKTISLAMDKDPSAWKAILKQLNLPWPQGRVLASETIGVSDLPYFWLFDPSGKLVQRTYNPKILAEKIEKLTAKEVVKETTASKTDKVTPVPKKATAVKAAEETMRVRFVDEVGKPVEGVKVRLNIWNDESGGVTKKTYTTDVAGIAEVELKKRFKSVQLWISKKGFAKMHVKWTADELLQGKKLPKEYDVRLIPITKAGGQVVDEQGKPVAGVRVQLMVEGGKPAKDDPHTEYNYWLATDKDAVMTDAEGRWHLDTFPDDKKAEVKIMLYHPDYISDRYSNSHPIDDRPTTEALLNKTATMTLRKGIVVQGQVTDTEGKPIKDAIVIQGQDHYGAFTPCKFLTDAEGRFRLNSLSPQSTLLTVIATGRATQIRRVNIQEGMAEQNFQMEPSKPVQLRLVDPDGKPMPDVKIWIAKCGDHEMLLTAENSHHPDEPKIKIAKQTDADGVWRWDETPDDRLMVKVRKDGYAPREIEITAGTPTKEITMKPEHRITGQVTDAKTGKPIPQFTLVPVNVFGNRNPAADWMNVVNHTDGQLNYLATRTDIPLRLQVHAMGYRSQTGPEFHVGDDTSRTQNFRLEPSKPISGVLLDTAGKPMPEAKVMLSTPTNHVGVPPVWDTYNATTDTDGRFTFPNPGEPFAIVAQLDEGVAIKKFPVDKLDVGQIQLEKWATVEVQFVDRGKPVPDALIFLYSSENYDQNQPSIQTQRQGTTNAEGRCTFTKVPTIPSYVYADDPLLRKTTFGSAPHVPLVNIKPGEKIAVKLGDKGATVEGKIVLPEESKNADGRPIALCYLIRREPGIEPPAVIAKKGLDIRNGWKNEWFETRLGWSYLRTLQYWSVALSPDGSFCISGVPAGKYDLSLRIYAKDDNRHQKPLAEKVVSVTVSNDDIKQGSLTLPKIATNVKKSDKKTAKETKPAPKTSDVKSAEKTMQVKVFDSMGKPVKNAKIYVEYRGKKARKVTDVEGKVDLVMPSSKTSYFFLQATIVGYPPLGKRWSRRPNENMPIPGEFTFTFKDGRTIGGVVQDESGRPVEGVKVNLGLSSDAYEKEGLYMVLYKAPFVTDAEGRWHLDHVPGKIKHMSIRLEHPDYVSPAYARGLTEKEQKSIEDRTSVMIIKRGITVTGTVTDPDGKPVADAWISEGRDLFSDRFPTTRTDEKGQYRLKNIEADDTTLTVLAPGLAPALKNIVIKPDMKPVDFQLEKGNSLRLRVVDQNGKPLPGVRISLNGWRGGRSLRGKGLKLSKQTDAEGRWTWSWAPEDAVLFRIFKNGYMDVDDLPLTPQKDEHVVVLSPPLTISGRVVDAETKQPIPRFSAIRGYVPGGSATDRRISWDREQATTGKNGFYRIITNRPSTKHNLVRIEADGYQPAISREIKNDEGSVTCYFALTKGKPTKVTVRLPDGKPAVEAEARLRREEGGKYHNMCMFIKNGQFETHDSSSVKLKVGDDGQLVVPQQECPFLLVVIHDQGFAKLTSEELATKSEITLTAWARLEGTIFKEGKPVANAKLDVYPLRASDNRWSFLSFQTQNETDSDGKFVFAKLKPGKWQVRQLSDSKEVLPDFRRREKTVELKPGETSTVAFGGSRAIVGQIEWPEGKPPKGDLTKIGGSVRPHIPKIPPPPKEVRKQGSDAVRAWVKNWQNSDEVKARLAKIGSYQPKIAAVDKDGKLRIEELPPGEYDLSLIIPAKEKNAPLPWEMIDSRLLRYEGHFTLPETSRKTSDKPIDLGKIPLVDESPKKISFESVKLPAEQAPGEKIVGTFGSQAELIRYVIFAHKENKAKIKSWQGKATVEHRSFYENHQIGENYSSVVDFVFDRKQKSVRWNNTLDKRIKIEQDHKTPQAVPQIFNGMMTPEAFYSIGDSIDPADPKKRPLTLSIKRPEEAARIRFDSQRYCFNPLLYFNTPHGDVAGRLSTFLGWADTPNMDSIKVIREGDLVTIDHGIGDISQRYTLSMSHGCNPVSYESITPNSTWKYTWTYEKVDGVWLPKTWTQTTHVDNSRRDSRDVQHKVVFTEHRLNQAVAPSAFTLSQIGVKQGDKVKDHRTQPMTPSYYEEKK